MDERSVEKSLNDHLLNDLLLNDFFIECIIYITILHATPGRLWRPSRPVQRRRCSRAGGNRLLGKLSVRCFRYAVGLHSRLFLRRLDQPQAPGLNEQSVHSCPSNLPFFSIPQPRSQPQSQRVDERHHNQHTACNVDATSTINKHNLTFTMIAVFFVIFLTPVYLPNLFSPTELYTDKLTIFN